MLKKKKKIVGNSAQPVTGRHGSESHQSMILHASFLQLFLIVDEDIILLNMQGENQSVWKYIPLLFEVFKKQIKQMKYIFWLTLNRVVWYET